MYGNTAAVPATAVRPALVQHGPAARRKGVGLRDSTGEIVYMPELTQLIHGPQGEAKTTRIGIIICARYRDCGGGKCFRAMRERQGSFSRYAANEQLEIAGYSTCGGSVSYTHLRAHETRHDLV